MTSPDDLTPIDDLWREARAHILIRVGEDRSRHLLIKLGKVACRVVLFVPQYNNDTSTHTTMTTKKLAAGHVTHIRVSPKDCMAAIDVCHAIGINTVNMSFAQVVKIALASCLESMRQNQVVPTRTGFEFAEMMAPFQEVGYARHATKLAVTSLVNGLGERFEPQPIVPINPELERIKARMDELHLKKEADEVNWTPSDQQEWEQLSAKLFNDSQP